MTDRCAGCLRLDESYSFRMNISAQLRICLTISLISSPICAENRPSADPDLPQPIDASATEELIAHSPFTRSVNLADTLRLTGIAYVEGKPVATFLNKETKQSFTVSDEPNAQGWKLTEASPNAELKHSEVTLQVGDEEIVMHYGDAQLSPGAAKKGIPTAHIAGADPRSRSDGEVRIKPSALLGEDGKALYVSLSSEARSKFKDLVKAKLEKSPDMTVEQRSAYAQKIFASLKASDQKSGGGSDKATKSSKKSKLN